MTTENKQSENNEAKSSEIPSPHPSSRDGKVLLRDAIIDGFDDLYEQVKSGRPLTGISTGFKQLDSITAGLQRGDLIVIGGRPASGKTSLALNIAVNASYSGAGPTSGPAGVLVFSLEIPQRQLSRRILSSESRVDGWALRQTRLTRDNWQELAQGAGTLSEIALYIDDTPGVTTKYLREKAESMRDDPDAAPLSLIVIDTLQLMQPEERGETRDREVGDIVRGLKLLARELDVPVIVTSALNRGPLQRDRRPRLDDMRDSGAIEDAADVVILLYRDEVYNRETLDAGVADVTVAKQRSGPTAWFKLRFSPEYARFDTLQEERNPEHDAATEELIAKAAELTKQKKK